MAADPNAFDYFKNGEPLPALNGVSSTVSFDYFKQGEPMPVLMTVTAAPAAGQPTALRHTLDRTGTQTFGKGIG